MSQTKGTINACACPWCKSPNDFRGIEDYGLEVGNVFSCDSCKKNFKISAVQPVTIIRLERTSDRGNLFK